MQKVRLTEEGLWSVTRTKDDIYNMYTTEEVLDMDNVSEDEKRDVIMVTHMVDVAGWVEDIDSIANDRIFLQIYEEHILEVICDKKPTRSLV